MEAERYTDAMGKKESHLSVAFSFHLGVSVLDPLPTGLFFALATGFNLGVFDDV
jgi:hypothetical protein